MDIRSFLKKKHIPFETTRHTPTFTAQELAAAEHTAGDMVAKTVVVRAGEGFKMLVLPASYNVRFDELKKICGTDSVRLATEEELSDLFRDCELGAQPPFGREYGLDVLVDSHLAADEAILFEAGHHDEAIKMKWADYERIEHPTVAEFAAHLH